MTQAMLELIGVSKAFGKDQVLKNLEWHVPAGKVIGLLGRNGAGKSTLLECALGLRELDQGRASIMGKDSLNLSEAVRGQLGYVPQNSELFEWMTGREMLTYFRAMYPNWNDTKVDALIKKWEIDADKKIGKLSGGQKQRLSIIRALAHEPALFILDEPVANLDPLGRREFLNELINGVIDRATTVVFSTHILSDLERVAMDVAFLRDGKLGLQGEIDEILETVFKVEGSAVALQKLRAQLLTTPDDRLKQNQAASIEQLYVDASAEHLLLKMSAEVAQGLQLSHSELNIRTMNLEDLFIEVTQ